jgi:putative transposase
MTRKWPIRQGLRLREYDYSQAGAYFLTICVQGRESLFGNIVDSKMQESEYGKIVAACWDDLPSKYSAIILDAFVVMPNHVHAIIMIPGTGGETPPLQKPCSLGQVVGYFKYQTTAKINEARGIPGAKVWQRGYYEHVIRDDGSLNRIR